MVFSVLFTEIILLCIYKYTYTRGRLLTIRFSLSRKVYLLLWDFFFFNQFNKRAALICCITDFQIATILKIL